MLDYTSHHTILSRRLHSSQTTVSIVIPAYNEEIRLGRTLSLLEEIVQKISIEIIVVCDGCTDRTAQIADQWLKQLPLKIITYAENKGKGYAIRRGVEVVSGQIVAFMDADGATPPSELLRLTDLMVTSQADIVIGSRRAEGAVVKKQPLHRHLLGILFSVLARCILSLPYQDTQCGFKLFRRKQAFVLFKDTRISKPRWIIIWRCGTKILTLPEKYSMR